MRFVLLLAVSLLAGQTKGQVQLKIVDSIRLANQIPEVGYTVVSADSILDAHVLGYHRTGSKDLGDTARLGDYFHLGSNTKAITGVIAAYLVEHNKIHWNTRFFDLFPEWKGESKPGYYTITLQDLLSHRAGIQPYTSGAEYQRLPAFKGTKSAQRKQFARLLLKQEPTKDTGGHFVYSNAGFSIAALMLEQVTGRSWEILVDSILSKEMGLRYMLGWPNRLDRDQPWGHWIENDSLVSVPPSTDYNLNLGEPAGDIAMPLLDYARFIQLNIQGLLSKSNFLTSKTYEFLHYGLKEYAIGWGNAINSKGSFSEHAGSAGTFYCYTVINRTRGMAFIVVVNSATDQAKAGVHYVVRQLAKAYKW